MIIYEVLLIKLEKNEKCKISDPSLFSNYIHEIKLMANM